MYNIEVSAPKPNSPHVAVALPEVIIGQGEGGGKPPPQGEAQVNPLDAPALSAKFSQEVLSLIQTLKGDGLMNMIEPVGISGGGAMMDLTPAAGVNPDNSGTNMQMPVQGKMPPQLKNLAGLVPGQVFSAEILDIQQGSVTLQMAEGPPLTARSLVTPDARIGDLASFLVRETKPGQIFLEFFRGGVGGGDGKVSASIIREALSAANMQHTAANAGIVEDLVLRNMPIDLQNLQRAAFFRYSMPGAPFEHIQFLLQNNFAATDRTVQVFQGLMSGELTLAGEIAKAVTILDSPNFTTNSPQAASVWEGLVSQLKAHQAVNVTPETPQGMQNQQTPLPLPNPNNFLEGLKTIAQEISTLAREGGNTPLAQAAENIADIIDFSRNITETKMYFQLPFSAENKHLAELHIFKKKGGGRKNDGKVATALIALDMAFLGRVEILVNKNNKNVNLQFRGDKDSTLDAVSLNSLDLANLLNEAGYVLAGLKTRKIDEKFDLTQGEERSEVRGQRSEEYLGIPKRYSFDVRI